jgi:LuxR family maltose regulon positive regulatory protein
LIEVLTLKSILHNGAGDQTAALAELEGALDLAHRSQRIRPFLEFGTPMTTMLKQLRSQGRFSDYIDRILAAQGMLPSPKSEKPFPPQTSQPGTQSVQTSQPLEKPLTHRELDIIHLLTERLSNKEIAEKLFISPETVKRHTKNIYRKLATHNRQEAVAKARAIGIL